MNWQAVLNGEQRPVKWIRSPEGRAVLEARSRDFVGMSARYAKMKAARAKGKS